MTTPSSSDRPPKTKDVWDVVQILGSALIPVAIAAGGWFYSEASSRAQIENARAQQERDAAIATSDARVRQAGLIKDFLDALTGSDPVRQRVAIQAVLLALPEDGPKLVRELSQASTDSGTARFARSALTNRYVALIPQLFATAADDRIAASRSLVGGWSDSPVMVDSLLAYAQQRIDNANGVFNTLGVLEQVTPDVLAEKRGAIEAFVAAAVASPVGGPRIRELEGRIRAKLR